LRKILKSRTREKILGVEIIKEVASKTNEAAGDGTTTAVVLVVNL